MVAKEILGTPVRLTMVLIAVLMVFCVPHGSARAAVIWSEDFDHLAPGTELTNANMPGWNVPTLGGSGRLYTTNESAASVPNAVHTYPSGRALMFHEATGANELLFSFYRRQKTNPVHYHSATAEIGFATNDDNNSSNQMTAPKVFFYMAAGAAGDGGTGDRNLGFYTQDAEGSSYVSRWDLLGVLSDSTWYDGLIRFEADDTLTFGYKALADTDFTLSGGHASLAGFTPHYVGVSVAQHQYTNGRTFLDSIVAADGVNVIPEPSTFAIWSLMGLSVIGIGWYRRRRAA